MLLRVLDAWFLEFMVPGHTKFESDVCAQKTAGGFACADVYNHGMLNKTFKNYVITRAYDADNLLCLKDATKAIFTPVEHITDYRQFAIIADDGFFMADLTEADPPEPPFPDGTQYYTNESLQKAVENLAERSLLVVLAAALDGKQYNGVGLGTGLYGPRGEQSTLPVALVRLFKRVSEQDVVWCEEVDYHRQTAKSDANIKLALQNIFSFTDAPPETRGKDLCSYYGNKLKTILEQYQSFVPPQFVPNYVDLTNQGLTDMFSPEVANLLASAEDLSRADTEKKRKRAEAQGKYKQKRHDPLLLAALPDNIAPQKTALIKFCSDFATEHGLKDDAVRRAVARLVKKRTLRKQL